MTLEIWLDTATKNLAPRAAAKVREDITAHFESSVEYHRLEGMDELEARALAVRELGDAASSAKGFERVHFTRDELKNLLHRRKQSQGFGGFALFFCLILSTYAFLPDPKPDRVFYVLGQTLSYTSKWWCAKKCSFYNYTLIQFVVQPIVALSIVQSLYFEFRTKTVSTGWLVFFVFLFFAWIYEIIIDLKLWQKLKNYKLLTTKLRRRV